MITLSQKRKNTYQNLSEETRLKITGAAAAWQSTATDDQLEYQKRAGRDWHRNADQELVEQVMNKGAAWHETADSGVLDRVKSSGREFHLHADDDVLEQIKSAGRNWFTEASMVMRAKFLLITSNPKWISSIPLQLEGAATGREAKSSRARAAEEVAGPPRVTFQVSRRWLCTGELDGQGCDLRCISDTKLGKPSF